VTAESEKNSYLGVVCSHCGAAIPVTGKPAKLHQQRPGMDSCIEEANTKSFPLRCKACEKEGVYAIKQISGFDGVPKTRRHSFLGKGHPAQL
jgi:hypothetical protein